MDIKRRNPGYILLLIRDGIVSDWESLSQAVERPEWANPRYNGTDIWGTLEILRNLHTANLIVAENPEDFRTGYIRVSANWSRIQTALSFSLKEFGSLDPNASLFVQPFFGRPLWIHPDKQFDLFVVMPFSDDLKPVYEDHIKNVAARLSLRTQRADDFFTSDVVMKDVWAAICACRLIVADCTGRNPNVFYEIGLGHAIGKPIVLITQSSEDIPFDLRHIRYIQYEFTPRGMKEFEDTLTKTVEVILRTTGQDKT